MSKTQAKGPPISKREVIEHDKEKKEASVWKPRGEEFALEVDHAHIAALLGLAISAVKYEIGAPEWRVVDKNKDPVKGRRLVGVPAQ